MTLDNIVKMSKTSKMPIDKICRIKTYLPIKEKFKFIEEYNILVKEHINDFGEFKNLVTFVFFYLLIVKYYTNIEIELDYEDFDQLQENGIINKITEVINDDYTLLLQLINSKVK
jgi:hypothetical protein